MARLSLRVVFVLALWLSAGCGGCGRAGVDLPPVDPSQPTALILSPDQATLFVGQDVQLRLVAAFADNTTRAVAASEAAWTVTDSAVISLDSAHASARKAGGPVEVHASWHALEAVAKLTVSPATLESLRIVPERVRLAVGESKPLRVEGTLSDGTIVELSPASLGTTYESSDPRAVGVSADGVLSGLVSTPEPVTLTAHNSDTSAAASVVVTEKPVTLARLELTPARQTLTAGTSGSLELKAIYSDGRSESITAAPDVTWTSDDPSALAVDQGKVTARIAEQGIAVTAVFEDQRAVAVIDVVDAPLVVLSIRPEVLTLPYGSRATFELTGRYADGHTQDLTHDAATRWVTDHPEIAAVSDGTVRAAGAGGPVAVLAMQGSLHATALVTVLPAALDHLEVTPATGTVPLRGSLQLQVRGVFTDGSTRDVSDASSGTRYAWTTDILRVEASGLVRGEKLGGPAIVTVQNGSLSASASLSVAAGPNQIVSLAVDPAVGRVDVGESLRLRVTATYGDGRTADVTPASSGTTYASGDAALLDVDRDGKMTGLAYGGPIVVSAGNDGVSTSASIRVAKPPPVLLRITVDPHAIDGAIGTATQLHVTGAFSDGQSRDVSGSAAGTTYVLSGDPSVAHVSAEGLVTLTGAGTAAIVVHDGAAQDFVTVTVSPRELVGLTVAPATLELPEGFSEQLNVIGRFSDGTVADLTKGSTGTVYASTRPDIASVSADGRVTSVATGKASISVANGGIIRRISVRSKDATVTAVQLAAGAPSVAAGHTTQLTCTATLSNGRLLDVTEAVSGTAYVSGNPAIATVSADGLLTGVSPGSATVTCLNHGVASAITMTVTPAVADDVVITPAATALPLGRLLPLQVTVRYSDGTTRDATTSSTGTLYFSGAPDIATVSADGVVKGLVEGGPVAITALAAGRTRAAQVTVVAPAIDQMLCEPDPLALKVGQTQALSITGVYSDGHRAPVSVAQGVTFRAADPGIATVDAAGTVSGAARGSTTIYVYASGLVARCAVSVEAP